MVDKLKTNLNDRIPEQSTTQVQSSEMVTRDTSNSLFLNSTNRKNLFACCILWSMSGFISYLIIYYTKYFEGSFFINYSVLGLADCLSLFWVGIISRRFRVIGVIVLLTTSVIVLCILEMIVSTNFDSAIMITIIVFMIRVQISGVQNYGYHLN